MCVAESQQFLAGSRVDTAERLGDAGLAIDSLPVIARAARSRYIQLDALTLGEQGTFWSWFKLTVSR